MIYLIRKDPAGTTWGGYDSPLTPSEFAKKSRHMSGVPRFDAVSWPEFSALWVCDRTSLDEALQAYEATRAKMIFVLQWTKWFLYRDGHYFSTDFILQ